MSDPVTEEDDLISQDDIDSLLEAGGGDDDAGELSQDDIDSLLNGPSPDEPDEDDAGELSQDDIDRMMSGDGPAAEEEEEAGELSQDDIDSLLNGPSPDDDEEEDAGELSQDDIDRMMSGDAAPPEAEEEEDDAGELSQDDIDRMMGGDAPADEEEDEDLELISQDDIDRLMKDVDEDDAEDVDDDEMISLEDIQGAMEDGGADDTPETAAPDPEIAPEPEPAVPDASDDKDDGPGTPEASEPEAPEPEPAEPEPADEAQESVAEETPYDPWDEPIDEGDASEVPDCMITQETMDALIAAGLPDPDAAAEDVSPQESVPEPAPASDEGDEDLLDGLDLMSASDDIEDDVTQEDIDALLQGSDAEGDFLDEDEDILISQDDIDTLLMAADQEDEDVLGDLSDSEDEAPGPEDALEDDEPEDTLGADSDQVVLEELDDAEIPARDEQKAKGPSAGQKIKALLRSKVVLAAASVLLFMGISIPISYFLFFSSDPVPLPEKQAGSLTDIDLGRDVPLARSDVDAPIMPVTRQSGTILLTNFIILASDQSEAMTYVYADVSIDYSDQRAYDEINSNLAFYRDLIYGAIQNRLVSEKNNEVTKADLLWDVESSIKKVLPPHYIDRITFKTFKAT